MNPKLIIVGEWPMSFTDNLTPLIHVLVEVLLQLKAMHCNCRQTAIYVVRLLLKEEIHKFRKKVLLLDHTQPVSNHKNFTMLEKNDNAKSFSVLFSYILLSLFLEEEYFFQNNVVTNKIIWNINLLLIWCSKI